MATTRTIQFTLNGRPATADVQPQHNLVELLQGQFGLTGARESCGQGLCGCCTVLVDGKPVSGCLHLAVFVDGCDVVTIEHLDSDQTLDPVQQAFIAHGAFQCGYCTPGFILMTKTLLAAESRSERHANQGLPQRQPVPLRRLSGNHRGGQSGRPQLQSRGSRLTAHKAGATGRTAN